MSRMRHGARSVIDPGVGRRPPFDVRRPGAISHPPDSSLAAARSCPHRTNLSTGDELSPPRPSTTAHRGHMTSNRNPHITLIQPSELLASVPHLLGFHPVDSLVVVGLRGSPETTISVVLRSDLPPPSDVRALAEYLLVPLTQYNATAAVMIVVGGIEEVPDGDLPQRELLARCESVLIDGGFPVVHQLWTPDTSGGRRWHCYDEFNCSDILPDPATTELATSASDADLVTYDRREDIVATLKPDPDEVLARRSASLDQLADDTEPDPAEPDDTARARLTMVQSAIDAAGAAQPTLSDNDVIRLSRALADHRVRDTCLDFDELPDVAAAERLWTALARATPAPERAEPACLLAFSAYARGDGVLAGIALAQAEAADPGHRLSGLLRSALALGLPPRKIRIAGIRAATFARKALNENQPLTPTTSAPTEAETPTATTVTEATTADTATTTATTPTPPTAAEPPEVVLATTTTETASEPVSTAPAAEAIVTEAPTDLATEPRLPADEPEITATTPEPPPEETVMATMAASSCESAATGPVLAPMETVSASSVRALVPTAEPAVPTSAAAEFPAAEAISASAPTMAPTSSAQADFSPVKLAGTVPALVEVPAAAPADVVTAEPVPTGAPAAEILAAATPTGPAVTPPTLTGAQTAVIALGAGHTASPIPTAEAMAPIASAPTPESASAVSMPAGAIAGEPTAELAPIPAEVTPMETSAMNSEGPSDIQTEAHQEAS
jgi:Domain of unknown function (DUF4192)